MSIFQCLESGIRDMGRRYSGPDQELMTRLVEQSRTFIDNELDQHFPDHINRFHIIHQGLNYQFYFNRNHNYRDPSTVTINMAVRQLRDEIFEIQHDGQDYLAQFVMPDGYFAATVKTFIVNIDLEDMPSVTRIYKQYLYIL